MSIFLSPRRCVGKCLHRENTAENETRSALCLRALPLASNASRTLESTFLWHAADTVKSELSAPFGTPEHRLVSQVQWSFFCQSGFACSFSVQVRIEQSGSRGFTRRAGPPPKITPTNIKNNHRDARARTYRNKKKNKYGDARAQNKRIQKRTRRRAKHTNTYKIQQNAQNGTSKYTSTSKHNFKKNKYTFKKNELPIRPRGDVRVKYAKVVFFTRACLPLDLSFSFVRWPGLILRTSGQCTTHPPLKNKTEYAMIPHLYGRLTRGLQLGGSAKPSNPCSLCTLQKQPDVRNKKAIPCVEPLFNQAFLSWPSRATWQILPRRGQKRAA